MRKKVVRKDVALEPLLVVDVVLECPFRTWTRTMLSLGQLCGVLVGIDAYLRLDWCLHSPPASGKQLREISVLELQKALLASPNVVVRVTRRGPGLVSFRENCSGHL